MPTTYSSTPYFDDYDQTKQFYRILFRPGRAVQARELTQLQTLIQGQIERFGNGIYKEGSFVTPPKETYDPFYSYVKLEQTYNTVLADGVLSTLVDQVIVGETSGVRAVVVNQSPSTTSGDPPTLFVKYLSSGTFGATASFADGEVITNEASTISVQAISTDACGFGTAFSVGECALYTKGSFIFVEEQTLIVEKYSPVVDRIIGFIVSESTINSDQDDTLLDPAVGTFNYFAPGADRYKISLTLTERPFTPDPNDDPNFVEIVRIEGGRIITLNDDPSLSVLGDTLARRTYDESGDYVVEPYKLEVTEHLRTSNVAQDPGSLRDGYLLAADGGNDDLYVAILSPGKAYVRGYEIESLDSRRVIASKARDFANVNTGTVATQLCSYVTVDNVYSIPSLTDIPVIEIYDRYNATPGSANGTKIGTARARSVEYVSGNVMNGTATFNLYLFNIEIDEGYCFCSDARQLYSINTGFADFTSNITPTLVQLSGTVSYTAGSNVITGVGTRFNTELQPGHYITANNQRFLVSSISNNNLLYADNNASTTESGQLYFFNRSDINDSDKDNFIVPFPYTYIKTVDPTNTETSYTTKRLYTRTLASNTTTIVAGTDETFSPFNTEDYQIVIASGVRDGEYVTLDNSKVVRGGVPTGSTLSIDLTADGLTTETIKIFTTVQKSNSASIKKTKTLVSSANVDFTSQADAQSAILSLGKADVVRIVSIKQSRSNFGDPFVDTGSTTITNRYTLDNGQKATFYDIATATLKPGQPKPTNPIRITFDYFTHGLGDYFTVDSYSGISYKDIPSVTINDKTFNLRDCLDFRPRVNDSGTNFTGSGSSSTEFIDPEIDYVTDYQYYLPRTDKIVLDKRGTAYSVLGNSSLNPKEPPTPDDTLPLFIIKQKPYVADVTLDIQIIPVDNKRYTMKDISKLETRINNLEYYTTLTLLEKDAQQAQIQDELGFERFKNGFLVDSFTGHGVGDSTSNPDYSVAINTSKREAGPLVSSKFLPLVQVDTDVASRASNNYVLTGDIITLPYTEEVFARNSFASTTENLNPFNVVVFNGKIKLDPPGDLWFEDRRAPTIIVDSFGAYQTLNESSIMKRDGTNIFGSIADIEQFRNGVPTDSSTLPESLTDLAGLLQTLSPKTTTLSTSQRDVILNTAVVPKMRNVNINMTIDGMKPNTQVYVSFDGVDVSYYCRQVSANVINNPGNIEVLAAETVSAGPGALVTDSTGSIVINFPYVSSIHNFSTGRKIIRVSDSITGVRSLMSTHAEAVFFSDGVLRDIATESLRPPPPPPPPPIINNITNVVNNITNVTNVTNQSTTIQQLTPPSEPIVVDSGCAGEVIINDNGGSTPVVEQTPDILDQIYQGFGRNAEDAGRDYWTATAADRGLDINNYDDIRNTSAGQQLVAEIMNAAIINGEHTNAPSSVLSIATNLNSGNPAISAAGAVLNSLKRP